MCRGETNQTGHTKKKEVKYCIQYIYICVCDYMCGIYIYMLYLEVINNGNKEPTQFGRVTFYFGRVGRIGSQTVHPFGIARPPKAPGGWHVHFHSDRDDVPLLLDPGVSQAFTHTVPCPHSNPAPCSRCSRKSSALIAASPCLSYDRSASFVCGSMSRAASISFQDMAIPPWEAGTKSQAPTVKYKLLTSLKSMPNFERIRLRITFAARKAGWRGRKTFKACSFLRKASDRGVATGHHGAPSQHSR